MLFARRNGELAFALLTEHQHGHADPGITVRNLFRVS